MSYKFPAWSQYLTFPRSSILPVYPSVKKCSALSWPLDPWPRKYLVKLTAPLLGGSEVCLVISQCTIPAHRSPSLSLSSPLHLVTPQSCHSPLQKQPVLWQKDPHSKGAFLPVLPLFFLLYQVLLPHCHSITHCHTPLLPVCSTGNLAQAPLIPSDKAK